MTDPDGVGVPWLAASVIALGIVALLARPLASRVVADPVPVLLVLFVAIGSAGALWPLRGRARACSAPLAVAVLTIGVGAFAGGRLLAGGPAAIGIPLGPLALNGLAAVTEEAFFRRLVYGVLAPHGPALAIIGSAFAFAVVHVTVWGTGVFPLDLAAGLLLSWQRRATGRWSVPAVTHVAANLLAAL